MGHSGCTGAARLLSPSCESLVGDLEMNRVQGAGEKLLSLGLSARLSF